MSGLGTSRTNCTIDAPGFGSLKIMVDMLSYGKKVISNESEARRFKAFYPQIASSGQWVVRGVFPSWAQHHFFMSWMAAYYNRVTDTSRSPLLPMTVSVPKRNFRRQGYPVLETKFGDEFGKVLWTVAIPFVSASEPTINRVYASKYVGSVIDRSVSNALTPAVTQDGSRVLSPFDPTSGGNLNRMRVL